MKDKLFRSDSNVALDVSIIFLLGTVMGGEVVFVIHVVVLVQPQLSK